MKNIDKNNFWHTVLEGLVVVDQGGMVQHINAHAARTLDLSPQQVTGQHFREIFCPSLPPERCWINLALESGSEVREHRFEREQPDGHCQTLIANFTPVRDQEDLHMGGLISIRIDDDNGRLREEREKQNAIFSSLAEGLFTVDNEWRVTSFNRAAERVTGWREKEVVGKYCKQVFSSEACMDGCPLAETLKRGKPLIDCHVEYHDKAGNRLPVRMNTAILYNGGNEAIGGVVSFRDCSPQKEIDVEQALRSGFQGIIGKNKRMLEVYQIIQETADSKASVLILGESGTGKELVANAIQRLSPRKNQPYVRVNCAAIPDTLLESELFGHVRGAFTDVHNDRTGRFELADGGTIFLDKVGDITPPAQLRLLRVLEEGEFQRLGSSETIRVDVRVLAATNRDLWQMVQDGRFRDDLYYRLNVIPITLPPLRERVDDLAYLIQHFMEKYRRLTQKAITEISDKAYDLLTAYPYPGNVRELENIIEHAFVRTNGNVITKTKLPIYLRNGVLPSEDRSALEDEADEETARIRQVLAQCHWNRQRTADQLGLSRTTLWRKMRDLDLLHEN